MANLPTQKICKFITISGGGVLDFDERVNLAMDNGYVPCGSMVYIQHPSSQPELLQTMIYAPETIETSETPECLK